MEQKRPWLLRRSVSVSSIKVAIMSARFLVSAGTTANTVDLPLRCLHGDCPAPESTPGRQLVTGSPPQLNLLGWLAEHPQCLADWGWNCFGPEPTCVNTFEAPTRISPQPPGQLWQLPELSPNVDLLGNNAVDTPPGFRETSTLRCRPHWMLESGHPRTCIGSDLCWCETGKNRLC